MRLCFFECIFVLHQIEKFKKNKKINGRKKEIINQRFQVDILVDRIKMEEMLIDT